MKAPAWVGILRGGGFGHAKRGTVLKSSLSNEAQQEFQDAPHGEHPGQ